MEPLVKSVIRLFEKSGCTKVYTANSNGDILVKGIHPKDGRLVALCKGSLEGEAVEPVRVHEFSYAMKQEQRMSKTRVTGFFVTNGTFSTDCYSFTVKGDNVELIDKSKLEELLAQPSQPPSTKKR